MIKDHTESYSLSDRKNFYRLIIRAKHLKFVNTLAYDFEEFSGEIIRF